MSWQSDTVTCANADPTKGIVLAAAELAEHLHEGVGGPSGGPRGQNAASDLLAGRLEPTAVPRQLDIGRQHFGSSTRGVLGAGP